MDSQPESAAQTKPDYVPFVKVVDGRGQPVKNLWRRDGIYYVSTTLPDTKTGEPKRRRVRIQATTVAQAIEERNRTMLARSDGELGALRAADGFEAFADSYVAHMRETQRKRTSTLDGEEAILTHWKRLFGNRKLPQITGPAVVAGRDQLLRRGNSGRYANLSLCVLSSVFEFAKERGHIQHNPTADVLPVKYKTPEKRLITAADIDALYASVNSAKHLPFDADRKLVNRRQFIDYCQFLRLTGARESEALAVRKCDVNFTAGTVLIGWDQNTKNGESRIVEMSPSLRGFLQEFLPRLPATTQWLFPSILRKKGEDTPAKTFRESLRRASRAIRSPITGFHLFRHYFISQCVMAGIDYLTIAKWVGHQDGGILIGKTYGHLTNQHRLEQARKLNL